MRKKYATMIAAVSIAGSMLGIDAEELLKIRAALTNKASGEYEALITKHQDSYQDIRSQLNGIERLLMFRFVESVSVTPTNMSVRTSPTEDIAQRWGLEPNAEIIPALDQETVLASLLSGGGVTLSPVSFKNKQKGFRVKTNSRNRERRDNFLYRLYRPGRHPGGDGGGRCGDGH
ncbi:MAG: hypothetical protein FWH21_02720, partial [Kiritimatiellaeota bacterium]|nr:hypothetical protein [Kiritimatiellota bacterium]